MPVFNQRLQNLKNFPKTNLSSKEVERSQVAAIHRAQLGCITSPGKSLELLRQCLQPFINKDINHIIQTYMQSHFNLAINNIKLNNGDDAITDYHIQTLHCQILEDAKSMYYQHQPTEDEDEDEDDEEDEEEEDDVSASLSGSAGSLLVDESHDDDAGEEDDGKGRQNNSETRKRRGTESEDGVSGSAQNNKKTKQTATNSLVAGESMDKVPPDECDTDSMTLGHYMSGGMSGEEVGEECEAQPSPFTVFAQSVTGCAEPSPVNMSDITATIGGDLNINTP